MNARQNPLHGAIIRALRTPAGYDLLDELEAQYCRQVFDENTNKMAYKAGQHDLVALLKSITEEQN